MDSFTTRIDEITGTLAGVLASADVRVLSDDALLASTTAVEKLGRLIDAARVARAGEIAERSRKELGIGGLAASKGCRNANELLQRVTLVSAATAEKRMRLGLHTRAQLTLAGFSMPARFSVVAAALQSGEIGTDAALAIVHGLLPVSEHCAIDHLAVAEHELVAAATGPTPESAVAFTADQMRIQVQAWQGLLDEDGTDDAEERAMRRRGLRLGRERDGLIPVNGDLMPEVAAKLARSLDSGMAPETAPAFLSHEERATGEITNDPRSRDQQRHDVFASLIDTIARSGDTPTLGGSAPTVYVSVRAEDLRRGHGAGHIDGSDVPISMRAVKQFACTGGVQQVVFDSLDRVIELGSPQRSFTAQQRKAVTLRDGGCLIPGCQIPAGWCEIHHVQPAADAGETHTDNGVLLCWFHHRTIDTSGWEIRMSRGVPEVLAPPWIDSRADWHRATKAPTALADAIRRRAG